MTRQQLRNKLARMLDTSTSTPNPWGTTDLNSLIAEAHEGYVEIVRPIERSVHFPLVGGKVWYRLSAFADDLLLPLRLTDPINQRRLIAIGLTDMDANRDQWEAPTGEPQWWTMPGWDWIGLYPHPASDGGFLRLDYAAWPQAALDDATPLEMDEEDEQRILDLAMADAMAWQWDEEIALLRLAAFAKELAGPAYKAASRVGFRLRHERNVSGKDLG